MVYYVFDGTVGGFYSAVFAAIQTSEGVVSLLPCKATLLDKVIKVPFEREKALRVYDKLKKISAEEERKVRLVLLCGKEDSPQVAFLYIRLLLLHGRAAFDMQADERVIVFTDYLRKVLYEQERMYGFVRFAQSEQGVFYAPISPDNDVLELILPHFMQRLPHEKFIIHDVSRKKAALYDGEKCAIVPLDKAELELSQAEQQFVTLWQEYYRHVTIASRPHEKQMRGYMPRRYWKFLPETQSISTPRSLTEKK